MMHRVTCWTVIAAATVLLAACGSGGDDDPTTVALLSDAALDGWVESDGTVVTAGGGPLVGDIDAAQPNVGYRQFFSFSLAGIPAGAVVTNATLQIHHQFSVGTPFVTHGVVVADHVDYGAALDAGDYGGGGLTLAFDTISPDATTGVKVINVTSRVQADLTAARTRSQYRLRFSIVDTDNDGVNDYVQFCDAENSINAAGTVPVLVVTYQD